MSFRERLDIDATAYRLVHGEGDLIPSLIIDRYGDYIALQALSQGTDRLLPEMTGLLVEMAHPKGIIARNDPRVRLLEGLEQNVTVAPRRHSRQGGGARREGRVRRRSAARPEDRRVSRPAGEPHRGGAVR